MAIRFNKEWMDKVEYKDWLLPEPSNNTKAKCRLCMRSFSLSKMGEPALKSHAQGKKHQNAVKASGKNTSVWGFLAHLVFYQTSLCNHDLSIVHSCHLAVASVHSPPSHRIQDRNFIFSMNMHMCPQYMHIKYLVILTCRWQML